MNRFWDLVEKSTITSALLALMFGGTACYLAITGVEPPQFLTLALGTIVGFFFSSKLKDEAEKARVAQQTVKRADAETQASMRGSG